MGFTLGSSALKGVTTPDGRPTTKFTSAKSSNSQQGTLALLKEEEILKIVKARIEGKTKAAKSEKLEEDDEETNNSKQKPEENPRK